MQRNQVPWRKYHPVADKASSYHFDSYHNPWGKSRDGGVTTTFAGVVSGVHTIHLTGCPNAHFPRGNR